MFLGLHNGQIVGGWELATPWLIWPLTTKRRVFLAVFLTAKAFKVQEEIPVPSG
jgi:hypothetical protein